MSRGLGSVQQAIMGAVSAAETDSLTFEALRWSLDQRSLDGRTQLPAAWNNSLRRAIDALHDGGRITISRRPLRNFGECVQHYPGKTLNVRSRSLRIKFLPLLFKWSVEEDGLAPKYNSERNEVHHLTLLRKDRPTFQRLASDWARIEEQLRLIYGAADESCSQVFRLICKGRSFFGARDVETRIAFSDAVRSAQDSIPKDLAAELQAFLERFIPKTRADTLKLRSFVHSLADVPSRGQCQLRQETLEYLYRRETDFVESMPGFRKPESKKPFGLNFPTPRCEFDPQLRKLIDHTVFQAFDFLRLA